MSFDAKVVPKDLLEAYTKKRTALLVGAGASVGAGLPAWKNLMLELIGNVEKNAPDSAGNIKQYRKLAADSSKFLLLATELKEALGNSRFEDFIEKRFRDPTAKPTALHKKLTNLKLAQFIVTTNYDTLLEQAYRTKSPDVAVCTFEDVGAIQRYLSRREFFILKAHGDAAKAGNGIVLTEHDYRQLLYKERAYQSLLSAMFTMFSIIFIGASLTDPEIVLLLRYISSSFQKSGPVHYALMPKEATTAVERNRWMKDFNVQIIPVSKAGGYKEIEQFLDLLASLKK